MTFMVVPGHRARRSAQLILNRVVAADLRRDRDRRRGGSLLWFIAAHARDAGARARVRSIEPAARQVALRARRSPVGRIPAGGDRAQGALFGYHRLDPADRVRRIRPARTSSALVFASSPALMACGNLLNSRIVMRLGMRRISHARAARAHRSRRRPPAWSSISGWRPCGCFVVVQAVTMMCFGLAASNFSAMAMENMGAIAGTASSLQGFVVTTGGAVIGGLIGPVVQRHDDAAAYRLPERGDYRAGASGRDRRARAAVPPDSDRFVARAGTTVAQFRSLSNHLGRRSMGGYQVPGQGSGDDGYDEEGYDESQRAEILEATCDGPNDGTLIYRPCARPGRRPRQDDDIEMRGQRGRRAGRRCRSG